MLRACKEREETKVKEELWQQDNGRESEEESRRDGGWGCLRKGNIIIKSVLIYHFNKFYIIQFFIFFFFYVLFLFSLFH